MIAVDTSVLVAIAFDELDCDAFASVIKTTDIAFVSAVSVVEARMVVHGRKGIRAIQLLEAVLELPVFTVISPGPAEIEAAHAAFITYGKGSGHPAGLNFGDLFSYALAKSRDLPLLFKGNDFSATDIASAATV